MKNRRSVFIPVMERGQQNNERYLRTLPSHSACSLRNSSPATAQDPNTETTVDVEALLQRGIHWEAQLPAKVTSRWLLSPSAALLPLVSRPNTLSPYTLPELSVKTDSGWHPLSSRKFLGDLLH